MTGATGRCFAVLRNIESLQLEVGFSSTFTFRKRLHEATGSCSKDIQAQTQTCCYPVRPLPSTIGQAKSTGQNSTFASLHLSFPTTLLQKETGPHSCAMTCRPLPWRASPMTRRWSSMTSSFPVACAAFRFHFVRVVGLGPGHVHALSRGRARGHCKGMVESESEESKEPFRPVPRTVRLLSIMPTHSLLLPRAASSLLAAAFSRATWMCSDVRHVRNRLH